MAYLVSRGCNFPHILHANTDFTGAKPAKSVFLNVRCFPPDRNLKITLKLSNNFTCRHGLAALRFQRNLNLFAVNLISGSQCLLANRRRSAALFGGRGVKRGLQIRIFSQYIGGHGLSLFNCLTDNISVRSKLYSRRIKNHPSNVLSLECNNIVAFI